MVSCTGSNYRIACLPFLLVFLYLPTIADAGLGVFEDGLRSVLCFIPLGDCGNGDPNGLCPVVKPLDKHDFDLEKYIEKTWYVQKQQLNPYQDESQLYCVTATYTTLGDYKKTVYVNNYGNDDRVNGDNAAALFDRFGQFFGLCARQVEGGEIRVAPCLYGVQVPIFDGPYWVVAVADDYSWAIITGGQPDQIIQLGANQPTLCTTQEEPDNVADSTGGLWLFTRERFPSYATIALMESKLEPLGIYGGNLRDVVHEGCEYEGAVFKK